jgi:YVTN family beta-propeller protein
METISFTTILTRVASRFSSLLFISATTTLCAHSIPPVNTVVDVISGFSRPLGVVVSSNSKRVYVVDPGAYTLSIIDATVDRIINNSIDPGQEPVQLALSPNRKTLYISNQIIAGTLTPVDLTDLTPGPTITGIGVNPMGLAVSPNGKEVYVAVFTSGEVYVFDTVTGIPLAPIRVGTGPTDVVFAPNGKTAYVVNNNDDSVSVIDVATGVVEGTPIPVGNIPYGINITPSGKTVYTINSTSVSAIDTRTNTLITTIDLSNFTIGAGPFAAVTPEGDYLYVAVTNKDDPLAAPGSLVLISTATNEVVGTPLAVGINPAAVAIAPNGKRAYITSTYFGTGEVTVIKIAR